MFEVIPAIDLKGGQAVRLVQGDFDRATVFDDDTSAVARRWVEAGARRLHVVDLDGSRVGAPVQLEAIRAIVQAVDVPVQLGGGVRSIEHVEAAFDAGLEQVILGTAAVEDPVFLDAALARYGERIVGGIDARDGVVAVRGWIDTSGRDALELARDLAGRGVRTIIYTDIGRDGTLQGPNVEAVARMVEAVPGVAVIASGGVSDLGDLVALAEAGAAGAIVGKALYTGAIDLELAIEHVRSIEEGTAWH
ncbi:MAG: 1-(5-phosphoribosyl)-5-[(5-phosphoribosylamino)methylideneamino]imidazole-4-carboxamide isomerase [Chloroflexota bacterium]|nr:1-(5-phosphoribosyl)-5-[(5-phosphoribosylamino)methylideneamino]imidazole-4-carboxamide isomerase [Chloroflexota bacterium]